MGFFLSKKFRKSHCKWSHFLFIMIRVIFSNNWVKNVFTLTTILDVLLANIFPSSKVDCSQLGEKWCSSNTCRIHSFKSMFGGHVHWLKQGNFGIKMTRYYRNYFFNLIFFAFRSTQFLQVVDNVWKTLKFFVQSFFPLHDIVLKISIQLHNSRFILILKCLYEWSQKSFILFWRSTILN